MYVGTGESNMRNSVSIGNGIYKTTDGGDNWKKIGLDSTEHISRIVINPEMKTNIAFPIMYFFSLERRKEIRETQ